MIINCYFIWIEVNKINMKQLRATIIADTELAASKRRFGLFSQPPPLAIGDDTSFKAIKIDKGPDGKPITKPRNMLAGPVLTGTGKKSFIQVPESIYQKDPYKNTYQIQTKYHNAMHRKAPMHQAEFQPASGFKTVMSSSYNYLEQKDHKQKTIKKDVNGRVKTEPANFSTNPMSKVENTFFKPLKHMPDPYSRKQQIEKQSKDLEAKKIIHENTFKSMSYGGKNFGKDKLEYGIDEKTKMLINHKKERIYGNFKRVTHQARFKLAAKGHGDPIGRYPQFINPKARAQTEISQSNKLKTDISQNDVEQWKPSSGNLTRPTPSISLMSKNMRRYL